MAGVILFDRFHRLSRTFDRDGFHRLPAWMHCRFGLRVCRFAGKLVLYVMAFKSFQLMISWQLVVLCCSPLQAESLIRISDSWRFLQNTLLPPSESAEWRLPSFNDNAWPEAAGGFVDASADGNRRLSQATRIANFAIGYQSLLFRHTFEVDDPAGIRSLAIRLQFTHGIVLWLNGEQVYQSGFEQQPASDSVPLDAFGALRQHNVIEEISLDHAIPMVHAGRNVVAVQVHAAAESATFTFAMELLANFVRAPMVHQLAAHSAVLSWKSTQPVQGVVRYGLTQNLSHSVPQNVALTEPEVRLSSLLPGSTYYYRVDLVYPSGVATSHVGTFRTPAPEDTHLKFAVFGDSGRGTVPQYDIARELLRSGADLVLHTGDTVYPFLFPELADFRFFSLYGPHMGSAPYYVSTGNHDRDIGVDVFDRVFHMPTNDTDPGVHLSNQTTDESYFTVVHGPAQFFVLYAPFFYQYNFASGFAQHAWLEAELNRSDRPWKFIVMHHPMRTSSLHWADDYNRNQILDTREVRDVVLPLAQKYGVQAVFSGHDHVYERFQPERGVVSVTTAGGGGNLYTLGRRDAMSSQFRRAFHFLSASIEGNECQIDAVDAFGQVLDTFFLSVRTDAPVQYRSVWHSPVVEDVVADDMDGNVNGQQFDFAGEGMMASPGQFSHAGKLYVNHDEQFVYIGLRGVVLPDDGALYLFVGGGGSDPAAGQPPSLLDGFLFDHWSPAVMGVLGDEFGDGMSQGFHRSGAAQETWQGVFSIHQDFSPVDMARVQQYNSNPQASPANLVNTHLSEQNADYIEMAIPIDALSPEDDPTYIHVAVVSGRQHSMEANVPWVLDTSSFGNVLIDDHGRISVMGVKVDLSGGPDSDGDGLIDEQEWLWGTDLAQMDSDDDGLPDGWEVLYGLSPVSSETQNGGQGDSDGDGFSNLQEWIANTDPSDAQSNLKLEIDWVEPQVIQLRWSAKPGVQYRLEQAASMQQLFAPVPLEESAVDRGSGGQIMKTHVFVQEKQQQFFRVIATPINHDEAF